MGDSSAAGFAYRQRDFILFISARFLSTVAIQVQSVAIGWQIYDIVRNPLALGIVGLCQFGPMFLLTLPAGDVSDRFNQRRVLALAFILQGLCAGLFLALTLAHIRIAWPYYAVLVLFGAGRAFSGPAGQSLLPFLVAPDRLPRALAMAGSAFSTAVIIGPALGGFLYAVGSVPTYAVCFLGFVAAAFASAALGGRHYVGEKTDASRYERVAEGVHFVRTRPVVLGAMSLDLFAVLLGGAVALLPVFARDILHVGPWGLGLLRSAPAVGAAITALLFARWPLERNLGQSMFAAVAIFGAATIMFGVSTNFYLSLAALFVLGASDMVSVVVRSTLILISTPDAMRGRVSAVNMLFIGASNELGEFESGITAAWFGTVPAVVLGGFGTLLIAFLWMRFFPQLRRIDRVGEVAPA